MLRSTNTNTNGDVNKTPPCSCILMYSGHWTQCNTTITGYKIFMQICVVLINPHGCSSFESARLIIWYLFIRWTMCDIIYGLDYYIRSDRTIAYIVTSPIFDNISVATGCWRYFVVSSCIPGSCIFKINLKYVIDNFSFFMSRYGLHKQHSYSQQEVSINCSFIFIWSPLLTTRILSWALVDRRIHSKMMIYSPIYDWQHPSDLAPDACYCNKFSYFLLCCAAHVENLSSNIAIIDFIIVLLYLILDQHFDFSILKRDACPSLLEEVFMRATSCSGIRYAWKWKCYKQRMGRPDSPKADALASISIFYFLFSVSLL